MPVYSLGKCTIIRKDGSALLNCVIHEIKTNHVVYIKNKTMHDINLSQVRRIDLNEEPKAIFFDKHIPTIQYYESKQ